MTIPAIWRPAQPAIARIALQRVSMGRRIAPKCTAIWRMSDNSPAQGGSYGRTNSPDTLRGMGSGAYRDNEFRHQSRDQVRKGLLALIMIADTNQEWAAWYYFTSEYELDMQLMGNYVPEVLAEKPKLPSHFTTPKAMTIEELCGNDESHFRYAALAGPPRDLGHDIFELLLFVQTAHPGSGPMDSIGERPTTNPIHLRFKKRDGASDVTDSRLVLAGSITLGSTRHTISCGHITVSRKNCGRWKKCLCFPEGLRSSWGSSELTLRMSPVKLSARRNHN